MKTIISGIKPSGSYTLGNYIGAIEPLITLQNDLKDGEKIFIFIADLHAITVAYDHTTLQERIRSLTALYLACGLDPNKVIFFVQSRVKTHSELSYLLETISYVGELERMTQFKDKRLKQETGVTCSLFTYPVLMAADILLYKTTHVPVGDDQKQHLELARNLAERFNNRFGETFTIPKPLIRETGARIMSLQNPTSKMSKSELLDDRGNIYLLDKPEVIKKKVLSAVTDSDNKIFYDPINKPGISNLLTILSCLTRQNITELERNFINSGYGDFKKIVLQNILAVIEPMQNRYNEIYNSPIIEEVLTKGAEIATKVSSMTISEVLKKMGL